MILRLPVKKDDRAAMGAMTIVVDPIVVTQAEGTQTPGPSGELIVGTLPAPFPWAWIIGASALALLLGWWWGQEEGEGSGPLG
jgi:hypothetical protein